MLVKTFANKQRILLNSEHYFPVDSFKIAKEMADIHFVESEHIGSEILCIVTKRPNERPVFIVNDLHQSYMVCIQTMAICIGKYLLETQQKSRYITYVRYHDEWEEQDDSLLFAYEFLLPEEHVIELIKEGYSLFDLSNHFMVSSWFVKERLKLIDGVTNVRGKLVYR